MLNEELSGLEMIIEIGVGGSGRENVRGVADNQDGCRFVRFDRRV